MVDNLKKIRIYEFYQFKACQIVANVNFVDLKKQSSIRIFPINRICIWKHHATYKGDRRATESEYYTFWSQSVTFPNNEQMVYNTAEDLKAKFKTIISRNTFDRNR
jgi:hypothetical protein